MDKAFAALDWALIRTFLAVAESGSLSAAARRLGVSQPTLGRNVKALEAQLGTELFHRRPRGFELTETGQTLVQPAQAMRDAAQRLSLAAAGQEARLDGTVRITASVAVALHHLPPIIARIREAEPAIQIELVPSDDSSNLLFREADIAVRMYRPRQLDLLTKHIGDLELGLFGARRYLERRGRPTKLADLMDHDFVGYDANPAILDGCRAAGMDVSREWFATRCDDNAVYWELVRAGCGLGFAQTSFGRATAGMEELRIGLDLPLLPVWLTAHEAMRQTPRVRRVWDLLAEGLERVVV